MRKYFTKRCMGLHLLALIAIPGCLYAGWWQYHVAIGGNGLSWAYTFEWPIFALYGAYIWWRLIHDSGTPFDRLWAAKQRAAVEETGRPIYQIPGWAMDKELTREVVAASQDAAQEFVLAGPPAAIARTPAAIAERSTPTVGAHGVEWVDDAARVGVGPEEAETEVATDGEAETALVAHGPVVIDAEVVKVEVHRDEELDAYNRYLGELSRDDGPKDWASERRRARQRRRSADPSPVTADTAAADRPALPPA